MRTDSEGYSEYLEKKYLPGRRYYLNWIFYPKILRAFPGTDTVVDLGCGTGEFLNCCRNRNRDVLGVDSNEVLARKCRESGFNVIVDNVCELNSLNDRRFRYALCDNVLEHLEVAEIERFFQRIERLLSPGGTLVCIVPGSKGFEKDPTHKTYVCHDVLLPIMEKRGLRLASFYYHPLNVKGLHKFFYLNMQVFEIRKL